MKKLLLPIFLILLISGIILWLLVSNHSTKKEKFASSLETKNLIVTALPKKNNSYYQPFIRSLLDFNSNFSKSTSNSDNLGVITTRTLNQNTFQSSYDDIWVRDVAPVVTSRLVKFKYSPEYLDTKHSKNLDKQFRLWLDTNNFNYHNSPLILDGGNCIWDKKETVIITDRILADNKNWTKREIIEQLKMDLKVTNIIIIPTEPGDSLSHADGMVKFIGENTLFISDFLEDSKFRKSVEAIIHNSLPDIDIVKITSSYIEEGQYDETIASAKGLYINMLETEKAVYVPQFDLPADREQLLFISKFTDKQVIPIFVDEISTMGGAVNCLTWYCPSNLLP